jgi:hypothetical protein
VCPERRAEALLHPRADILSSRYSLKQIFSQADILSSRYSLKQIFLQADVPLKQIFSQTR